jgi:hypothetical protein
MKTFYLFFTELRRLVQVFRDRTRRSRARPANALPILS